LTSTDRPSTSMRILRPDFRALDALRQLSSRYGSKAIIKAENVSETRDDRATCGNDCDGCAGQGATDNGRLF
jgi:hypothetical protein